MRQAGRSGRLAAMAIELAKATGAPLQSAGDERAVG